MGAAPAAAMRRPTTSLWAVASLLCSLAICPPLCLIGPLLGVWALIDFRGKPYLTGRRYAVAGIVIGLVFTAAWTGGGIWWHYNGYRPMVRGPQGALAEGFAGDTQRFQSQFTGRGASVDPQVAAAFIAELRGRYGTFRGSEQDPDAEMVPVDIDRARPRIPYVLAFDDAQVKAEAVFVIQEEGEFGVVLKWESIVVKDPELGDIVYPPPE